MLSYHTSSKKRASQPPAFEGWQQRKVGADTPALQPARTQLHKHAHCVWHGRCMIGRVAGSEAGSEQRGVHLVQ